VEQLPDGPALFKGVDDGKDQSYFLHAVRRPQLARALMPLGGLRKPQVREMAREAGLPVFAKRDSTGICFIGERPFADFLARYIPESHGAIETPGGVVVGEHRGLAFYTLGQRGGLGVGGQRGGDGSPWYVAAKDPARNVLVAVQGTERSALSRPGLRTGAMNWLAHPPGLPFRAGVQVRHRQADQPATVSAAPGVGLEVRYDEPQWALAPGQVAALYHERRCLGGGVIEETL